MKKWFTGKKGWLVWIGLLAIASSVVTVIDQGGNWTAAALAGFGAASIVARTLMGTKTTK